MSAINSYIRLTSIDDKPVFINPAEITAIYVDIPAFVDDDATAVCFDGTMLFVKESPETVFGLVDKKWERLMEIRDQLDSL